MVAQSKSEQTLESARAVANAVGEKISLARIESMTRSPDTVTRLAGVILLQDEVLKIGTIRPGLEIVKRLLADGACRWQALNVVAEGIQNEPQLVWDIVDEYASSPDDDLRMGVATVLLEHLLEMHFDEYFRIVRERALTGDAMFLNTLESCWFDEQYARRVGNLLRSARRGRRHR